MAQVDLKFMEAPNPEFNAVGKHQAVQKMFAEIAPTYDRLNHLLSANIDKRWRKLAVNKIAELLAKPDAAALDLCCGTGDLTLEISRRAPVVRVIGCDFCHPMLVAGKSKFAANSAALLTEGDALNLPFANDSFEAVTIAFGLRNLENVERGIREIHRVLKPNGRAVILEFSRPIVPFLRGAFGFYFTKILPRIGALVSGSGTAYTYLPASVSHFPDQKSLVKIMCAAGFINIKYDNLSLGIAALHYADKI